MNGKLMFQTVDWCFPPVAPDINSLPASFLSKQLQPLPPTPQPSGSRKWSACCFNTHLKICKSREATLQLQIKWLLVISQCQPSESSASRREAKTFEVFVYVSGVFFPRSGWCFPFYIVINSFPLDFLPNRTAPTLNKTLTVTVVF